MVDIKVHVQEHDFELQNEYEQLRNCGLAGAIVTFVGLVRDFSQNSNTLLLTHYPGMTEKSLESIAQTASERWQLQKISIIHRVGRLCTGDQIVFVGVSSAHRAEAFSACEFIMDFLKTQAPFWKKEGDEWVEAKQSDQQAAEAWHVQRKAD